MKTLIAFCLLLVGICIVFAATSIPAGDVSGAWTLGGSPYLIGGNVTVPKDQALAIEPKVVVQFTGHYQFIVHGKLQTGDPKSEEHPEELRVHFTSDLAQNPAGWGGLRFENAHDACHLLDCDIENARATGEGTAAMGGAIYCETTNLAIVNCSLHDNSAAAAGGAIACVNSAPKLANVTISKNTSGGAGGGFYATGGDVKLANVTITENTGGGVAMTSGQLEIANCSIAQNKGCGFAATGCAVKIANATIAKNEKGGLSLEGGSLSLANCTIHRNAGVVRGAGLFIQKANVNLANTSVSDNTTGAVCALDNSEITLTNCSLEAAAGKALDVDSTTTVTKINCRIKE
jgi:predicted outer membrane repeat protein